jgi:hypothetical protein
VVETHGNKCTVCKASLGGKKDGRGRLNFPTLDIYQKPMFTNQYLRAEGIHQQLHFAIAYLCVSRATALLCEMTQADYLNYYNRADYYALHQRDTDTKCLILRDMPYTNLSRENNAKAFHLIEQMLADFHAAYYF